METQTEQHAALAEPKRSKRSPRRIAAALHLDRRVYARMRRRAEYEGLSFGTWLKRAALKELHRKPSL